MGIKKLGRTLMLFLLGANISSAVLMILCGFSPMINPQVFHLLVPFALTFPIFVAINIAFFLIWVVFSPKYVWISVVGLVLSFYPIRIYCPINLPDPHPQGCIKVMSYNVKGFSENEYNKNTNYKDILAYLGRSDADIVCFQEYNFYADDRGKGIVETLKRWPYTDSVRFVGGNNSGICSRYPIVRRYCVYSSGEGHGSFAYTLKLNKDTILVINNHFVSNSVTAEDKVMYKQLVISPEDAPLKKNVRYLSGKVGRAGVLRAEQADSIAAFLQRHQECPVILCGDFNDSPLSYAHHRVAEFLTDAYVATGLGPGISYHASGMYFRLDNVFCNDYWQPYSAQVDSHIAASDHYPVSCYLKLRDK